MNQQNQTLAAQAAKRQLVVRGLGSGPFGAPPSARIDPQHFLGCLRAEASPHEAEVRAAIADGYAGSRPEPIGQHQRDALETAARRAHARLQVLLPLAGAHTKRRDPGRSINAKWARWRPQKHWNRLLMDEGLSAAFDALIADGATRASTAGASGRVASIAITRRTKRARVRRSTAQRKARLGDSNTSIALSATNLQPERCWRMRQGYMLVSTAEGRPRRLPD